MLAEYDQDPESQKRLRRKLTAHALFAGCKTGRVLKKCLGADLCDRIVWDESSRDIGSHASSVFAADLAHMAECYDEIQPDVVISFGRIATDAIIALREEYHIPTKVVFLSAPHPAARHPGVDREIELIRVYIQGLQFMSEAPKEVEFG